jgi:putative SOS response-associated peptidase YedK
MCGRYGFFHDPSVIGPLFNVEALDLKPRYNIAPSQDVAIVRLDEEQNREMTLVRWGLLPSWVKDPKDFKASTINARADKVVDSPSYREPFKRRRCLVPASGFYAWKRVGGSKQPYFIRYKDGRPLAFAGLWDRWTRGDEAIESCTIITTDANDLMKDIHHRMPVVLAPNAFDLWLGEESATKEELEGLLVPYPNPEEMEIYPVSKAVNSPKTDAPELVTRVPEL